MATSEKRKTLVFVTGDYPYGKGEAFIEHEINYTASVFDEIMILTKASHPDEQHRQLPRNVKVIGGIVPKGFSFLSKLKTIFNGLFSIPSFVDLYFLREFFTHRVFRSKKRMSRFFSAYFTVKICLKSKLYRDIFSSENTVFYYYWGTGLVSVLPFTQKKSSNIYIARLHSGDVFEYQNADYLPLRKEIYSALDHIFPIGDVQKEYLNCKYPFVSSKITTARLGTIDMSIGPIPRNEGVITLVTCSRITPVKRLELMLEALKDAKKEFVWHHFGGKNFLNDGSYYGFLEKLSEKLPKNVKVVWHGAVPLSEILFFYKNNPVDLFINTSIFEGIPVSIMEAMSFGIPILATNVGATREAVTDASGKLISPDITAAELLGFLESAKSEFWSSRRVSTRLFWEERFDAKKNYTIFSKEILTLTGASKERKAK